MTAAAQLSPAARQLRARVAAALDRQVTFNAPQRLGSILSLGVPSSHELTNARTDFEADSSPYRMSVNTREQFVIKQVIAVSKFSSRDLWEFIEILRGIHRAVGPEERPWRALRQAYSFVGVPRAAADDCDNLCERAACVEQGLSTRQIASELNVSTEIEQQLATLGAAT